MSKLRNAVTKPWWRIYSRIRGKRIVQTREQTITHLVAFYLFSVSFTFLLAAINVWEIPVEQDILGLMTTATLVILGYDLVKDVIATEFDAATKSIEESVRNEFHQEVQALRIQLKNSNLRQRLDQNYLSYLKQSLGYENLKLQEVNSELKEAYSEDRLAFGKKLDEEFRNNKASREVRCVIHDLNKEFLQQLAIQGIIDGLNLELEEVLERTRVGNDLHSLRVDIYAYLSAWLICSIDNDLGFLMPIQPIGMRYINEKGKPDKETYRKIVRAIANCILSDQFKKLSFYPKSDPLSSELIKNTIVDYLNQFLDLIDQYSYDEAAKF
ncbi:hypothetical protein H6F93_08465 [Leptolyngbya sp. FACHB-671]|uniref:hypothetical protein n=1 Tax=Leptolyngbya sp. FACHB-671 TaxID=2692812 RepID=UPI001689ED70|nr:hypothetical protein [Leptolyngbya sp. FACHB-671]MBD2067565.1 hypothetical protein [Leptolyngbya sp. FACHB-671]